MFKFLKDKINSTISKISEKIKSEGKEEIVEEVVQKRVPEKVAEVKTQTQGTQTEGEKKSFFERLKETFVGKEDLEKEAKEKIVVHQEGKKNEESKSDIQKSKLELDVYKEKEGDGTKLLAEKKEEKFKQKPKRDDEEKSKRGFFHSVTEKIVTKKINENQFEDLFWELELALLENNVAVEVIEKIKDDLKIKLVDIPIKRTKVEETIAKSLTLSIKSLFQEADYDLLKMVKKKKPYVICFFGINGSGKTTTIAKLAKLLKDKGMSVVISASDTFRAASIDQLQKHADIIGIKLIKHDYGSDPAAVAFDAIKHAESKKIDVVLIDTAGRMHSNTNLIDEMRKIVRVSKPDLKIFVGEAITGNDCIEQAKTFKESIGIDGIILAKADIDEKGGAAVSASYVTKSPILYLGTGQKYEDLQKFDPEIILKGLGLEV